MCIKSCIYSRLFCVIKSHTVCRALCGNLCSVAVMKKPHGASGFVWKSLQCGGNEKATLRARLRVALKFLKLTAFVNEILWWAHRDSNPGPTD